MNANVLNMSRRGQFARRRVAGLDLLRVAMALLIYMFHSNMHFGCSYGILNSFVSVGALAMTGFFMLSGYALRLVYGEKNLIEKNELSRFYVKRMIGILPLYYTLALLYMVFLGKENWMENLMLLPIEALGLQTTFTSLFGVTHNGGTWFISCLLLGYLIYPFLQTVVSQLSTKQKVLMLFVLMGIELWATIIRIQFHTAWLYENPFYRILEFTMGLIVADVNMTADGGVMRALRSLWVTIGVGVVMLLSVSIINARWGISDYMFLNWIVLPCFILMLFGLGHNRVAWLERSNVLSYASKISYAFFLSQYFAWPIGRWFVECTGYNTNWIRIMITFSTCIVISILMYEIVQCRMVEVIKKKYNI